MSAQTSENRPFPWVPEPPGYRVDWDALLSQFPWLGALADCPQDPQFHAEGDVLTHTKMVVEALVADEKWRALDDFSRSLVFLANCSTTRARQSGRK